MDDKTARIEIDLVGTSPRLSSFDKFIHSLLLFERFPGRGLTSYLCK